MCRQEVQDRHKQASGMKVTTEVTKMKEATDGETRFKV